MIESPSKISSKPQALLIQDLLIALNQDVDTDVDMESSKKKKQKSRRSNREVEIAVKSREQQRDFLKLAITYFFQLLGKFDNRPTNERDQVASETKKRKRQVCEDGDGTSKKTKDSEDSEPRKISNPTKSNLSQSTVESIVLKFLDVPAFITTLQENYAEELGRKFVHAKYTIPQLRIIAKLLESNAMSAEALHHFFVTHSELLPTLMSDSEYVAGDNVVPIASVKFYIVSVFFKIYRKKVSLCSVSLLPFLFSLYTARTNFFDRLLLAIFFLYDSAGVDILDSTGYLWGAHGKVPLFFLFFHIFMLSKEFLKRKADGAVGFAETALYTSETLFSEGIDILVKFN